MQFTIREFQKTDLDDIAAFAIEAWEPVFASFKQVLGETIFEYLRPHWREEQERMVRDVCKNENYPTFIADVDGKPIGFVSVALNQETRVGEIYLMAVDPDYQNQEIGTELSLHALAFMKSKGMVFAEVGTGGDPGHAPARRAYEKAGFTGLPLMRYYKMLDD